MKKKEYTLSLFNNEERKFSSIVDMCNALGCTYGEPAWPDKFGQALMTYLNAANIPPIKTLSLFSGAGGLDIGFHDLGFDIVESVEIESKFCNTLMLNSGEGKRFAHSKVNCIDIREYTGDSVGNVDFIIGGPPCQTFSAAGRRQGGVLGTTDARGVLFKEYVRLLDKLQPKGFLMENVYGITGAEKGEAWTEIKRSFSALGYKLFYRILDAADYGVPQHRERLIIIGLKEGTFEFPRPINGDDSAEQIPYYNAGTAVTGVKLTDAEAKIGITGRFGHLINNIPPGLNYSFYTSEMGHPKPLFAWRSKFSDFMYKADPAMPVRTIKAQGGQYTGPLHWDTRYFSYAEFKRLQTFPDDYDISGNKQVAIHQIGNSVPPQLARMLALAIRIQVFETPFPFSVETIAQNVELSFRKNKRDLTAYYQAKAKKAIKELYENNTPTRVQDESFFVTITDKFQYIKEKNHGDYEVKVQWRDELSILVTETAKEIHEHQTEIKITPHSKWSLPISSVFLNVKSNGWEGVMAAWRVLDRLLITYGFKADLVQLNGYFQYESQIDCQLSCTGLNYTNIFQSITNGEVVGRYIHDKELAKMWELEMSDLLEIGQRLRTLGYEIRNSKTNPQIPEGYWLIPYKFPTLQLESVQRTKSLK